MFQPAAGTGSAGTQKYGPAILNRKNPVRETEAEKAGRAFSANHQNRGK